MAITATRELSGLYTSTFIKTKARIVDQIFQATPAMAVMQATDKVMRQNGGTKIVVDLEYEENPSVQWLDMQTGKIDVTKHDPLTQNEFEWALVGGTVWARHYHTSQNTGEFAIFNLQQRFVENVKKTIGQKLEAAFFGTQAGKLPYGLRDLCGDAPTTGTVGIVNRATYPWYRNGYYDMSSYPFSLYGKQYMGKAFLAISVMGPPKNVVLFTDSETFLLYEALVGEKQILTDKRLGDLEFENVVYRGRPLYWSPQCPTQRMYMLDLEYYRFVLDTAVSMELGEWIAAQDSIDLAAHVLTQCQNIVSRPKSGAVLFNISD